MKLPGSRSMEGHHNYDQQIMSADRFQTKDNSRPIPVTAESTKSFQQLQLTPTTWTMPHPVCFFSYPGQSSSMPFSPASAFYPGFSSAQSRGFPFLNSFQQGSLPPNYMQVQANTVQFLPRFNYAGSLAQPTGQGIGPTGPAMSNSPMFPLNQQPSAMSQPQQPIANTPYFCGYMSLPTIRFPPIPGTSQSDRSADEAKDLLKESRRLLQEDGVITQQNDLRKRSFADFLRGLTFKLFYHFFLLTYSCAPKVLHSN